MHLLHALPGAGSLLKLQSHRDTIDRCEDLDDLDLWMHHADYDAVLLDPIAQRGFGRRWAQRYRARVGRAGLVFLADDLAPDLAIPLYDLGDDVVRLPLRPDELLARVGAIVRRCRGFASAALAIGPLVLDRATLRGRYRDRDLRLTRREFAILEFLMLRAGQVVSQEAIVQRLYQERDEAGIAIVGVYVCRIRAKLRAVDAPDDVIRTNWGNGFFIAQASADDFADGRRVA